MNDDVFVERVRNKSMEKESGIQLGFGLGFESLLDPGFFSIDLFLTLSTKASSLIGHTFFTWCLADVSHELLTYCSI